MPQPAHADLIITNCHQPKTPFYLCELPASSTSSSIPKPLSKRSAVSQFTSTETRTENVSFPFPVVQCPDGHLTHTFLEGTRDCWENERPVNGRLDSDNVTATMPSVPLFMCKSGWQRVSYGVVCDHLDDCLDASDEDFCINRYAYIPYTNIHYWFTTEYWSCWYSGPHCNKVRYVSRK
jgi:hypothetical protein